ncbi:MAG: alpha/beta hydrolase [Burkholderiales bacterium]
MNRSVLLTVVLLPLLLLARIAVAEPVTLTAADGVKVFGEFWPAANPKAPLILAFHQAGASRAEYGPLVPRLNKAGFSVLAIDQRSGGDEFGGSNQTVTALGRSTDYAAALADLEAALVWGKAKAQGAPVLVWGSSYSAALSFLLAARHPADLQGLLAFSPGEYLGTPGAVGKAAQSVRVPVFITQSSGKDEIAASRAILAAIPGTSKTLFIATKGGVHGSSTLRADRNAAGAEQNWAAVMAFLAKFKQ